MASLLGSCVGMTTWVHINVAATIAETVAARVAQTGCSNATYCYYCRMHREGDVVALLIGHQTCDLQVVGSSPGWAPLRSGLGQAT